MLHHQHSQYVELQENLLGLSPLIATITIITICKAFKCVPVALSHVTPTWYHSHGSLGRPFKGNPCNIHNTHHCRHSWSISQEFMFWQTLLAPSETLVFILVHTRNPLFQMFQVWSNAAYIHSLIINRVAKCQTFYTDQNMASDIFKKSFTTYDYTYVATGALNGWWGSDYCKTNDELLHHLPFTWKTDLSKYFIIFPISQWGSRDVWCEQLVASKTISEARTESNWEVSLSQKNFFTLCLYRPGWTLGSFLVNQYQVVKYELVQWEAY